jgi:hypothetical protein
MICSRLDQMDDKTGPPFDLAAARNVGGAVQGFGGLSAEIVVHSVASPPTAPAR